MARTTYRDGRKGRRRGFAGVTSVLCLLLLAGLPACGLDSPSSPNEAGDLTGQNPNQQFTFTGSITLSVLGGSVTEDNIPFVRIGATVRDASGNPVPNGILVTFRTDLGAFQFQNQAGELVESEVALLPTFGGVIDTVLLGAGGATGTATIRATLGQITATRTVEIEPTPVRGSLGISFGPDGEGETVLAGIASVAQPLDVLVGATALDFNGDPIIGAVIEYHFVVDTTGTGDFVTGDDVLTGPNGVATNLLRVSGSGDIAIEASLRDPVTGELVAVSNRIFLSTRAVTIISLAFPDGTTTSTGGPGAFSRTIVATVTDTDLNPKQGFAVRFTIKTDGTEEGVTLTNPLATSDSAGQAITTVEVPAQPTDDADKADRLIVIVAEIISPTGQVLASSNTVEITSDDGL